MKDPIIRMKTHGGALLFLLLSAASAQSAEKTLPELTKSDRTSIRAAYEAGRHGLVRQADGTYAALNPGQGWRLAFDGRGFTAQPENAGWTWGLDLQSYGFPGCEQKVQGQPRVTAGGQRATYAWDDALDEWFINDQRGLEQGWTLKTRPVSMGGNLLSFLLSVRGGLKPELTADAQAVRFVDAQGGAVLTYAGLKCWDADGRTLPSHFAAGQSGIRVVVDERGARYPITIDPMAQQAYLKASNTNSDDVFGNAVAVSGDTVIIGAPDEDSAAAGVNDDATDNSSSSSGAAYVFVRTGTTWTQQAYLKASNTDPGDQFGYSVSVSGDTIVVGAPNEKSTAVGVNGNQASNSAILAGAAYVFVRNGTTWTQQAYLKASNTASFNYFGRSVTVDGNTIAVGADQYQSMGAVYVFVRNGTTWTQQATFSGSNTGAQDQFGWSVGLSGDTLVVGANLEDSDTTGVNSTGTDPALQYNSGAAYVFVRIGTSWGQEAYLKASNTGSKDYFGTSVAVSGDTVVVGALFEDSNARGVNSTGTDASINFDAGAAYVFVRSAGSWTQEAYLKASNSEEFDVFGASVAISGNTLVVGASDEDSTVFGINGSQTSDSDEEFNSGAAYVFVRSGSSWTQQAYLKASNTDEKDFFGTTVAISGDTVVIGAPGESSNSTGVNANGTNNNAVDAGAAYTFTGFGPVVTAEPEIEVEYPAGTGLVDGASTINVGGTPALQVSSFVTVTISNSGTAPLKNLAVSKSGTGAADYKVGPLGATTLVPGASTTFTVRLNSGAAGSHIAKLHIASNDANENPFDINLVAPEIEVQHPDNTVLVNGVKVIDFGDIPTNETTVFVRNVGSSVLYGADYDPISVVVSGAGAADYTVGPLNFTELAPGEEKSFTVTFDPASQGTHAATLDIRTNDADEAPFTILLKAPEVAVEQPAGVNLADGGTVDFGTVTVGLSKSLVFTIKNKGSGMLRTSAVTSSGLGFNGITVTGSTAKTLAPNASTTFTVKVVPDQAGLLTGGIAFENNDGDEDPFNLTIQVTGFAKPTVTLHPTPQLVGVGGSATFLVAGAGSGTLVFTWLKNGKVIPGALNAALLTLPNVALTDAGAYSAIITNAAGSISSGNARLGVVGTTTTPVLVNEGAALALTVVKAIPPGPAPTHQWRKGPADLVNGGVSPAQIISGAAKDKLGITKMNAPNDGSYTCVVGMDGLTQESGPFTVVTRLKPVMNVAGPFQWRVGGTVTDLLTAANGPTSFAFTNLPAGVAGDKTTGQLSGKPTAATTTSTKTFSVTASNAAGAGPALVIGYGIAALPETLTGTYNGLLERDITQSAPFAVPAGQTLQGHGGSLYNLVITGTGLFTGTVKLEDKSYAIPPGSVINTFPSASPTASVKLVRGTATDTIADLTLAFSINLTTGELTGTVTDGLPASTPIPVRAWRSPWTKTFPADDLAGYYTAALELDGSLRGFATHPELPQGGGYLTLTLSTGGIATWGGVLADGTAVTGGTTLGPDGQLPLHLMLYTPTAAATAGSVLGWMQAGPGADTTKPGDNVLDTMLDGGNQPLFDWKKLAQLPKSTTRSYRGGFPLHRLTVIGGGYTPPLAGSPVIGLIDGGPGTQNARLAFTEGDIASSALAGPGSPAGAPAGSLRQSLRISTANTVTLPASLTENPGVVTMQPIKLPTGLISGTFTLKDTDPTDGTFPFAEVKRSVTWVAVFVPRLASAVGHFQLPQLPSNGLPKTTPTTSPQLSGRVILDAAP